MIAPENPGAQLDAPPSARPSAQPPQDWIEARAELRARTAARAGREASPSSADDVTAETSAALRRRRLASERMVPYECACGRWHRDPLDCPAARNGAAGFSAACTVVDFSGVALVLVSREMFAA